MTLSKTPAHADDGGNGAGADGQGAGDDGGSGSGDAGGGSTDPDPKSRKRYRPGRKSGSVYDFDVDDDGNVTRLDVARVYTGEDEPDRVELPAVKDDGGAD